MLDDFMEEGADYRVKFEQPILILNPCDLTYQGDGADEAKDPSS